VVAGGKHPAVVNGEAITRAEFEAAQAQAGPSPIPMTADQYKLRQAQILYMMIDELLLKQYLKKHAPTVPAGEIDKKMTEMVEGLRKRGKTPQDFYKETSQTEAEVRDSLNFHLRWQAYLETKVTDAEVQRYFTEFKDFFDGTTVHVNHIVVRVPPGTPDAERQKAITQLNNLRAQLLEKKIDFPTAAKTYSQCPTAPNGGDLGYITRKNMAEEPFARAAFALPVGQISEVVQTSAGVHLILVTERKAGPQPADFAKIKDEVRQRCIEDMNQGLLGQLLDQLRKAAAIEINLP
jgi:parvulin-like peptidyl-prolyl isomerase